MINIRQNVDVGLIQPGQGAAPAPAPDATPGRFQGRQVRAQPHAQKVTPPAEPPAPKIGESPSLELRQAKPANTPGALLRQARYAALPSVPQLLMPGANLNKDARASALPSIRQLMAHAGPVRSPTLLERFVNAVRRDKSSENYQNILSALQAYHGACQGTTGSEAKLRLEELTATLDSYSRNGDRNQHRLAVIADLRTQITQERTTLADLLVQSGGNALPHGANLSQALAFVREEVSLQQMQRLVDQGLELDQPLEAREILNDRKLSETSAQQNVGYKKVLSDLQAYHDFCDLQGAKEGPQNDTVVADKAMTLLESLYSTIDGYLEPRPTNAHTQALQDLKSQISNEIELLQGMQDALHAGGELPQGASLPQAMAFAREGVSLHDMARLMAKGLLPSQAMEARELMDSERGSRLVESMRDVSPQQRAVLAGGFSDSELVLLELSGLGTEGGAEYRRLGIPITHQTLVNERTDTQRLGAMNQLGKGSANKVYAAKYNGPDGIVNGVFKPLKDEEGGWVAAYIGIDLNHARIANRNLATQDVALALGFDVVVECHIGARQQRAESGKPQLELGLVMGRAPGKEASKALDSLRENPEVRREVTKLQLLDHLVGQGDRHANNYFVHTYQDQKGQTKVKVTGIDNDQCFGRKTRNGDDIRYANTDDRDGYRGTRMPQLIDTDMAAAIRSITPQSLSALLSDKLSPAEIKAAQSRLQSMLNHINTLERKNQVITPDEWNARVDVSAFQNASNSYFARDAGLASVTW